MNWFTFQSSNNFFWNRQAELVHFDSERNEYYSRPDSIVYMVAGHSSRDSEADTPDILQDCMANDTEEADEPVRESKFNFLRKKSVMIRNRLRRDSSRDEERQAVSFTPSQFDCDQPSRDNVSSIIFYN